MSFHIVVCFIPYLEATCEDNERSWAAENLHMHSLETDRFIEVILNRANIKHLDFLACFITY